MGVTGVLRGGTGVLEVYYRGIKWVLQVLSRVRGVLL